MPKLRLNKILAQAGVTSRRGGDRLIFDGQVAVNDVVTREPGTLADPDLDRITVDGRPIPLAEAKRYVVLHKPRGSLATRHDPGGRPIVTDLVTGFGRLYPVGRLDADVEGVLLLTNDGALTHRLLHPRYGLRRVYEADVGGRVLRADLTRWRAGVMLDDGPAKAVAVELCEARSGDHRESQTAGEWTRLRLTFTEGRKHEVKRYCETLGHPILKLRRVAFGPLVLGALQPGEARELTRRELGALRAAVEGPPARSRR